MSERGGERDYGARDSGGLKVIVFGSRSWDEPTTVKHRLRELPPGSVIVHGASPGGGADYFADVYGKALGFTVIPVPINDEDRAKSATKRGAPIMRNLRMAHEHYNAHLAIGFWDGKSPGSKHMKGVCERQGIPVEIVAPRVQRSLLDAPIDGFGAGSA